MVDERVTDGTRIAELLASELHGRADGGLDRVRVVDAVEDQEPTADGTLAYRLATVSDTGEARGEPDSGAEHAEDADGDGRRVAAVYVQPERVRIEFRDAPGAAAAAASERDLRTRPAGGEPPRTLVFVESGAATKPAAEAVGVTLP
jgi:hypothetical protein